MRRIPFNLCCVLAWCAIATAADGPRAAERADAAGTAETRDALLLLDRTLLHVRLQTAIDDRSPTDARRMAVQRILSELDTDGDGQLSREESQRSPLFREKQRPGAQAFIQSLGNHGGVSPREILQRIERLGGETVVYRQNSEASDSDDYVFKTLDADGDDTISQTEMSDAVNHLLALDLDDDECVTMDEIMPPADPSMNLPVTDTATRAKPASSVAEIVRDTRQTLLPAQLIQKYDKNRDRKLSAEEIGWSDEKLATCDRDGDRALNLKELGGLAASPVDIELAVDVVRQAGRPMLRVVSAIGDRADDDRYPDLATIRLPHAVITFAVREVDPFAASMAIAMRAFNELDTDNNGYLDRDEAMVRERLGRGLFDQIDADGDQKIFGEEMKTFIRARGEPLASTCQVTAVDDGAGFFTTLDANGDRRVSMREMRYADQTLRQMQRDEEPGLARNEPMRRYRIEIARGVFNPFGNADRPNNMNAGAVAVVKPRPVGPIWFQRWDRNNDGDLTWREFLGPRDAFEKLDTDGDDLIDPREAEAADALAKASRALDPTPVTSSPVSSRATTADSNRLPPEPTPQP